LVSHLKAQGLSVGVLSRGYGRKPTTTVAVLLLRRIAR
jgi:tetraacyldisaccharide-1-P 4'-kinase